MMSKFTCSEIERLRLDGYGPTAIADELYLSVNTVKSHIRRRPDIPNTIYCLNCGRPVPQNEGRKMKKYCCDRCRSSYWNHRYRKGDEARDLCG